MCKEEEWAMKWEETVNEINYVGVSLNSNVKQDEKEEAGQQEINRDVAANDMFK